MRRTSSNAVRVALFDTEPWEQSFFEQHLPKKDFRVTCLPTSVSAKELKQLMDVEVLSVFIHSKVGARELALMPKLRLIATRSTGFDHIDMAACAKAAVKVANVPTYGENTVAEHAFALLLSITRKIHVAYARTIRGDFSIDGLRGMDLMGKTIGIVGCGRIGEHAIRMALGFGMKVLVFDPFRTAKEVKHLGATLVKLPFLLRNSDVVTLHAPLTKSTYHIINKKNVGLFKKGSILINTARGGLVETDALVLALKKGWIDQTGLDVLEEEQGMINEEAEFLSARFNPKLMRTMLENHILLRRPDVLITPHNAFNSQEGVERILATTVENITLFASGKKPHLVSV